MEMYINTGKVIGQDFVKVISFRREEKISEVEYYGIMYKNFGFDEDGQPLMIKIELVGINVAFDGSHLTN